MFVAVVMWVVNDIIRFAVFFYLNIRLLVEEKKSAGEEEEKNDSSLMKRKKKRIVQNKQPLLSFYQEKKWDEFH